MIMYILGIIGFLYLVLIGYLYLGLLKTPVYKFNKIPVKQRFSILVVFRDESENLNQLLDSILLLNYPKEAFEVLLINDFSTDNSVEIVAQFIQKYPQVNLKLLHNKNTLGSPKKNAINLAIQQATNEWILTTDADCILPIELLQTYNSFIAKNKALFIAGPVHYSAGKNFVDWFQYFNWMSLTGSTIGSFYYHKPMLCSGANLCYSKSAFQEIKPYENYQNFAGGDDIFLMQQFVKTYPGKVKYLLAKEALVYTKPVLSWRQFFQQQLRWAKKTTSSEEPYVQGVGLVVFLMNLTFVFSLLGLFYSGYFWFFILLKIVLDSMLVRKTLQRFDKPMPVIYWLMSSFCYPFINISIVFGSFRSSFNWKGRKFKK